MSKAQQNDIAELVAVFRKYTKACSTAGYNMKTVSPKNYRSFYQRQLERELQARV
jgi:hypothetical protein